MSDYLKKVKEAGTVLQDQGLTPFDLITWEYLLELKVEIDSSSSFIDLGLQDILRNEVVDALKRKATALDEQQSTTFYSNMVRDRL